MNRFQAMAEIMMLLNPDDLLKPGSQEYRLVRKVVSAKIERLGPEAALAEVRKEKKHLLDQIRILCMWNKASGRNFPIGF